MNQYARWALDQNLAKGDVVCLLMSNRPEYLAIWLGITSVGVVVSLLNTNLGGSSLAHCIRAAAPKCVIASAEFVPALASSLPLLDASPAVWIDGAHDAEFAAINLEIAQYSGDPLSTDERRATNIDGLALLIYTSGTTGLPKAAKVSHARVMQWSHWFAGMMQVSPPDRMYNCLPMYHSVGGVQVARRNARRRRLRRDSREILREPILERYRSLGLHAVSVHRRALPLPVAHRTLRARNRASHSPGLR